MGLFTAVAGILALATALVLARPLLAGRGATDSRAESRDARDAELYRDQLAELDRDLARGTISAAEAEGARAEVARRLISATTRAGTAEPLRRAPPGLSRAAAVVLALGLPLLGAAVYLENGAPGLPDLPFADRPTAVAEAPRPTQEEAEARAATLPGAGPKVPQTAEEKQYAELIGRLEKIVAQRPDDVEGHRLLANGYMRLGEPTKAWRTYRDLAKLLGDKAGADVYATQMDAMVSAAGGYVSPEAEALLEKLQALDPQASATRYYGGLLAAQNGDIAGAIDTWEKLRAEAPADAGWTGFLDAMIAEAKKVQTPSTTPGPSASDMSAAASMTPEERQQMIEGMVARLEERLTTEGGSVEDWVRLVNAYVQLGRMDDARRAYDLGAAALKGDEAGALREQALIRGVIQE